MKKIILPIIAITAVAASFVISLDRDNVLSVKAACYHNGMHYSENKLQLSNGITIGNNEYWICCKCLEVSYTKPDGVFTDGVLSESAITSMLPNINGYDKRFFVEYGKYPQTKVTDESLISTLTELVGTKPTADDANEFSVYKEYVSGVRTSATNNPFMWGKSIAYDGDRYLCMYFTSYKPKTTELDGSEANSYQSKAGYTIGNYYFFKWEPVKWNIIRERNDGEMMLLAQKIMMATYWHGTKDTVDGKYANNYANSWIRTWLNQSFYVSCFSTTEKTLIKQVTVPNGASTTAANPNTYACENTTDYVTLPCYSDFSNSYYNMIDGENRKHDGTDYAYCNGLYYNASYDYSLWWLRSPDSNSSYTAMSVDYPNGITDVENDTSASRVILTDYGVLPAITLNWK